MNNGEHVKLFLPEESGLNLITLCSTDGAVMWSFISFLGGWAGSDRICLERVQGIQASER